MPALRLSTKIGILVGLPAAVLLALTAVAYNQATRVESATELVDGKSEAADYALLAQEMKLNVVQVQQWLTDISATRAAPGLDDGFALAEEHARAFQTGAERFEALFRQHGDTTSLQNLEELRKRFDVYYDVGQRMAKAYVEQGQEQGNAAMREFDTSAASIGTAVDALVERQIEHLNASMYNVAARCRTLRTAVPWAACIGIALTLLIFWRALHSITTPIHRIMFGLTRGAEEVNRIVTQLASGASHAAEGAGSQAAALEESSSALEQMAATTRSNADSARRASELARRARQNADAGNETMARLDGAMDAIHEASSQIGKITKVIEEIAFQTNLLALNAAVEAARAGEHGKGFAVVAEEVRRLAQRSAEAVRDTTQLIQGTAARTQEGRDVSNAAVDVIHAIVADVAEVATLLGGISQASDEQARGVEQLSTAVSEIDGVTQRNAAGAEQSAAAAQDLSIQTTNVNAMVAELARTVGGGNRTGEHTIRQPAATKRHENKPVQAQNCWDVKKCGRTPGGKKVGELGVCPAYPDHGRDCWAVAGTFCGGKVQGHAAQKLASCMECAFYQESQDAAPQSKRCAT